MADLFKLGLRLSFSLLETGKQFTLHCLLCILGENILFPPLLALCSLLLGILELPRQVARLGIV